METKKISFGFMKTKKQEKPLISDRKEYIECVEEKSIKVVGGGGVEEKAPLVIPMKPNTLMTAERLKQIAEKVENFDDEEIKPEKDSANNVPENETLEQMAARELLEESKKAEVIDVPKLVVPVPAQPILVGQKESTLNDYESVPIQDFGMAMLRGMGWAPGKEQSKYKQPQLRPKGLGLGADKVVKENQKKKTTKENEEELSIVKKAYVKITTGKYAGFYGQVVSLDEENGRAMVDISIKKETVSLSEFMMQPVAKTEYDKQSKVINADSYEEYKNNENIQNSSKPRSKNERDSSSSQKYSNDKRKENEERNSNGSRLNKRNDSPESDVERRRRNKSSKKYSSNESLDSSESDYKEARRRSTSSESNHKHKKKSHSKSSKVKRDIDKKRKGKKKKRDRDRSPNYKKYRK